MTRATEQRDQDATPFSSILAELCRTAGARCAALVDQEGETVDYSGVGDPFDIRILAAEWCLVLQRVNESAILGQSAEFSIRAKKKSFLIVALPEGYALVVQLGRRATGASERALSDAKRRLCEEAGFELPDHLNQEQWRYVEVQEESRESHRPMLLNAESEKYEVTVLGRIPSHESPRERSYRVRLSSGEERTLVREPLGYWFIEEDGWS